MVKNGKANQDTDLEKKYRKNLNGALDMVVGFLKSCTT